MKDRIILINARHTVDLILLFSLMGEICVMLKQLNKESKRVGHNINGMKILAPVIVYRSVCQLKIISLNIPKKLLETKHFDGLVL